MPSFSMAPSFTETPELRRIPSSKVDRRSDQEIIAQLTTYRPVTSQKNVWTFWDAGFWAMRPYVRRFVIGWARRLGPEWTVRVLDHVEASPTSVHEFLDRNQLHEAFNTRTMTGPYVGAHSGDVVRLPLLYRYGGVWMDAGTMLFRHMDDICWRVLCDPSSPYEICGFAPGTEPGNDVIMNGFIAAQKGNEFIRRWHEVYLALWRDGRTDCIGSQKHPLLRQVKKVQVPLEMQERFGIDNDLMNDYVAHALAFKRVRMLRDASDGFDGPRWWEQHAYVLPVQETFLAQIICEFDGQRQYDLLALARPEDQVPSQAEEAEKAKQAKKGDDTLAAEKLVTAMLSQASTMKLSHGLKNNKLVHLSKLWDREENASEDIKPGSYAAYLHWGSENLEQTRRLEALPIKCIGGVLEASLLEVVGE
jgi:hypothetical protein